MRHRLGSGILAITLLLAAGPAGYSACCYFAAQDKDVNQPGQRAFITYDAERREESFTVQPKFEGNASDFGMVIPTPSRPKLDEMPRDFFAELAVFTILEPMDMEKYKPMNRYMMGGGRAGIAMMDAASRPGRPSTVKELEAGTVGSLDYKIISAERTDDLFEWLKLNKYSYSGDEATLDYYVKKKWLFTTMKIDPTQMKRRSDGSYEGQITPTRFTFSSEKCVYPLKITQISVKDKTEALFYVQTSHKVDLPGDFSYQYTFVPMWQQAISFAIPEKVTADEKAFQQLVAPQLAGFGQKQMAITRLSHQPASLEWAKKVTVGDIEVLSGTKKYNREAPAESVEKLKLLKGHVSEGQFITKIRKEFSKNEMEDDLVFVPAEVGGKPDKIEYFSILPTSPP